MKTKPLIKITLLDVGWGDSIFLESIDKEGKHHFGLIDSNDTTNSRTTTIFLKRFFRRHEHYHSNFQKGEPVFDFILLSHHHADHGSGLQEIIQTYGTRDFWYPKGDQSGSVSVLLDYAHRARTKIKHHEALETDKPLPDFGNVHMSILWPPPGHDYTKADPNDSSVVLDLLLDKWNLILTGDAGEPVWEKIAKNLPTNIKFFKVPHHGSKNGTSFEDTSWYKKCSAWARLGISCDIRSSTQFFPSDSVIKRFEKDNRKFFRTDQHHHITFVTDGDETKVIYSH